VAWQSPPNNWGEYPPKRIAQGAKAVHFVASSDTPNVVVTFGVGAAAGGTIAYPYSESFSPTVAEDFTLSPQSQSFTMAFGAFEKYDRVLSAFNWTVSGQKNDYTQLGIPAGGAVNVYVDDVVWDTQ
jgi:hypothetical protein